MKKLLVAFAALLLAAPAAAQWQTPNHSIPIGQGGGVTGFNSVGPAAADLPLVGNGASADPSFRVLPNAGLANPTVSVGGVTCVLGSSCIPGFMNSFTVSHAIAPADCGGIVQMGSGAQTGLTLTLPASPLSNGFTGPCPVTIIGQASRAIILSGFSGLALTSPNMLWPTKSFSVAINSAGAWALTAPDGRYRPLGTLTLTVDTSGSDAAGDGLGVGGATSFRNIQTCMNAISNFFDFTATGSQPTCGPTVGQTFTEALTWAWPPVGTNTLNLAGQGGAFILRSPSAAPALFAGNGANIQLTNITITGTGAGCGTGCIHVSMHNASVVEPLAGVTCDNTGAGGACFKTDINTAGGARLNIDNGLTVSGTVGTIVDLNGGSSMIWNSTLVASGLTLAQVFAGRGAGTNLVLQGNFGVSGSFGTARQWAILNNATLCNVSGVAVPGSTAGIASGAGFAAGVIVNSGTSASAC